MYNPSESINKMLGGMRTGNPYARGENKINTEEVTTVSFVLGKLKELKLSAQQAHHKSAGKLNYAPLIRKLEEAELIGHHLHKKASGGKL
jgi:hypothetical protein